MMAGVDHTYQYSVEVKNHFSLFFDDTLNNEDPDLLLSKIRNERAVKKREKPSAVSKEKHEIKATEPKPEPPADVLPKAKALITQSAQSTAVAHSEEQNIADHKDRMTTEVSAIPRGRGAPRGFYRGPRAPRAAFRPPPTSEANAETSDQPGVNTFTSRGRFRPRGRPSFNRRGFGGSDYRLRDQRVAFDMDGTAQVTNEPPKEEKQINVTNGSEPHLMTKTEEPAEAEAPVPVEGEQNVPHSDVVISEDSKGENEIAGYTLAEYRAMHSSARTSIRLSSQSVRRPNDGEDVFANMVAHRKITEVSDEEEVEIIEKESKADNSFEIDVTYTDRVGNRGRGRGFQRNRVGQRGVARGGRGRGYLRPRVPEAHLPPPSINDDLEFPSLK